MYIARDTWYSQAATNCFDGARPGARIIDDAFVGIVIPDKTLNEALRLLPRVLVVTEQAVCEYAGAVTPMKRLVKLKAVTGYHLDKPAIPLGGVLG